MKASTETADRQPGAQRLDKWLWYARAAKSRTLAAALVTEGKVRVNKERTSKPSQPVKAGDVVTLTVRGDVRVLEVKATGERRGPASQAALLFEELTQPRSNTKSQSQPGSLEVGQGASFELERSGRAPGAGRPTKKERRDVDRLLAKSR